MIPKPLSLARLAEWCVERSRWARRQPAFAFLWGQLISSRLEAELKAGGSPDPADFERLALALAPVFDGRDEQLSRAAWLSLSCALSALTSPSIPSDQLLPQVEALLGAWPERAPRPDDFKPMERDQREASPRSSFFCIALFHGHPGCAQSMSRAGMPWTLPDESGLPSAQLPGAILSKAQGMFGLGPSGEAATRDVHILLMAALAQGARADTLMSHHRAPSGLPGFPGFAQPQATELTLGALAANAGCSQLLARCEAEHQTLFELGELSAAIPSPANPALKRGPSL